MNIFIPLLLLIPHIGLAQIDATALSQQIAQWVENELSSQDLEGRTQVSVNSIDSRVRLEDCDALDISALTTTVSQGRFTVKAECQDPNHWKIHVPVEVERSLEVITLRAPIKRGEIIQEQDIILTAQNVNKLTQGYFTSRTDVLGKIAKRSLAPGMAVLPQWLDEPILIERQDKISIIAEFEGLTVKAFGIAQESGRKGESIKVKNVSSKRTVHAQVIDQNTVKVPL